MQRPESSPSGHGHARAELTAGDAAVASGGRGQYRAAPLQTEKVACSAGTRASCCLLRRGDAAGRPLRHPDWEITGPAGRGTFPVGTGTISI